MLPKKKTHTVFNNQIRNPYDFKFERFTKEQDLLILSSIFEQLMIFDTIVITTNRLNFALYFLISRLGINNVERMLERGFIKFMIWSPILVFSKGFQKEDGSFDESPIYEQPPIVGGSLHGDDLDPENNIKLALDNFGFVRDRKRIFTRIARDCYIVPEGMNLASDSAKMIIDAYTKNNLAELGLPFEKDPNQLNVQERELMQGLGHKVLETAILSKYYLKSYENYEHLSICQQNLNNIGKAYNVAENTSVIFNLENLPNLKQLFLSEKMDFDSVLKIRYLSNAKYYRNWINTIGENANGLEITKEYLNEIKGTNKFFESSDGKFLKMVSLFTLNTAIGAAFAGPTGAAAAFTMGMLETYLLDGILKGKNPSMFIEDVKKITN